MPPKFGGAPKCALCGKSVYSHEEVKVDGLTLHNASCFRCTQCNKSLTLAKYGALDGKFYCPQHHKKLFISQNYADANDPREKGAKASGSPNPRAPVFCPGCGKVAKNKFCNNCGAKLEGAEAVPAASLAAPSLPSDGPEVDGSGAPEPTREEIGQAKLEDSNCAKLGGDEDRAVKKSAAETEKEWEGAGQEAGMQIWRVENKKAKAVGKRAYFGIKAIDKEDYGKFWDGDSYIVLITRRKLDGTGQETDALEWDVHFWLGQDSTQDEMGVAAYKTVELDTLLDDGPVQHRQVQGYESDDFLKEFDPAIVVMDGGIEGGFTHVDPDNYEPRLMRVTKAGKGRARVYQVPNKIESLCQSDCFILDLGLKIYPFIGKNANRFEEHKMREFIRQTDDDRGGKPEQMPDNHKSLFEYYEVDPKEFVAPDETEVPKELEPAPPKLYRLSLDGEEDDGFHFVAEHPLAKSMLESEDAFVVDAGDQIFAWVGNDANPDERREIMVQAMDYIAKHDRPKQLPITRVWEGQVVAGFENCFTVIEDSTFKDPDA